MCKRVRVNTIPSLGHTQPREWFPLPAGRGWAKPVPGVRTEMHSDDITAGGTDHTRGQEAPATE